MCRENLIDFDSYVIFEDGRIFSKHRNRFINGTTNKDGYVRVCLKCKDGTFKGFLVHRLIFFYFNGEIPEDMRVNHIDENKKNNAKDNVNLLSHKDNCNWGTRNKRISERHKGIKLGSPSEETRKKQSAAQKKRFETSSPWNKGIKNCFSEETLNKMRKPHKKNAKCTL